MDQLNARVMGVREDVLRVAQNLKKTENQKRKSSSNDPKSKMTPIKLTTRSKKPNTVSPSKLRRSPRNLRPIPPMSDLMSQSNDNSTDDELATIEDDCATEEQIDSVDRSDSVATFILEVSMLQTKATEKEKLLRRNYHPLRKTLVETQSSSTERREILERQKETIARKGAVIDALYTVINWHQEDCHRLRSALA